MTPKGAIRASELRSRFAALCLNADQNIPLAEATLLIGAEEQVERNFQIEQSLSLLHEMGVELSARLAQIDESPVKIFNEYFFRELGFRGNHESYYDPRNSVLQDVLARRTGIPITLSVIYMEVGRRASLIVEGVGLPGHFLVRVKTSGDDEGVLVDVFGQAVMYIEDCQDKLDSLYGGQLTLQPEHLRPLSSREILVRILNNLKGIYQRQNMHREALAVVERILLLIPGSVSERRDRGLLLAQLGRTSEAIKELRLFLRSNSDDAESSTVREQLRSLHLKIASLN